MGTHPIFESDFDCLTEMESEPMLTREKSWEDFLDKTHVDHELMTQLVKGYLTSEGFHDISQIMDEEAKEIGFAEKNESCEPTELQKIQRSNLDSRINFGRQHRTRRVAD